MNSFENASNETIYIGSKNTMTRRVVTNIYAFNFLLFLLITFTSYLLFVITVRKISMSSTLERRDHVTFTVQFLVLVDLLLDVPYIIVLFYKPSLEALTIAYAVFYLHIAADPLIFLLLNPHNRKIIKELMKAIFCRRLSVDTTPIATTDSQVKDSNLPLNQPVIQE